MRLGFLVVRDMRGLPFKEIAQWGAAQGFYAVDAPLEHVDTCRAYGLHVGAIPLRADVLSPNEAERREAQKQACQIIEQAAAKGIKRAMIGHRRQSGMSVEDSIAIFGQGYGPVAECAQAHGFKLVMEIYHAHGQNLAITPELIRALFKAVPNESLGICLDPSHLVVQGIDYIRATQEFAGRIYYAHAKDTEILENKLYEYGIYGRAMGNDRPYAGWWRYRLPGYGRIDWARFLSTLVEVGYDDILAIEHEDDIWYGSVERNQRGLLLAKQYLDPFVG